VQRREIHVRRVDGRPARHQLAAAGSCTHALDQERQRFDVHRVRQIEDLLRVVGIERERDA
jgi:hypothetical protein